MNTPLHIAIQNGNIEIIKALLANGCYINARNDTFFSSIEYVKRKRKIASQFILLYNANLCGSISKDMTRY